MKRIIFAYKNFNRLPLLIKFLCLGCVVTLFQVFFSMTSLFSSSDNGSFTSADQVVPPEILERAIAENYFVSSNDKLEDIQALKIVGQEDVTLFVIDFNTLELCGRSGCLYSIYLPDGTQALRLYLHSNVPGGFEVFEADSFSSEGAPCLIIHQPDLDLELKDAWVVSSSHYCYQKESRDLVRLVEQKQSIQKVDR